MTFEEANDRYLGILKKISYIEDQSTKDNMYNLARLTIGMGLCSYSSTVKPETESEITSFEKMLSTMEG